MDMAEAVSPSNSLSFGNITNLVVRACRIIFRGAPVLLALYALLTLVSSVLPVLIAWLTKLILDALAQGISTGELMWLATALAAAGVVVGIMPQAIRYLRSELDREVGMIAQEHLFIAVERFIGMSRFENPYFLDRLRLSQQASAMPTRVIDGALGLGGFLITITGFLSSLFAFNPFMVTLVLASGAPIFVAEISMSRRRAKMYWTVGPMERREIFYSDLLSNVAAAKEVRLFGIGPFLRERMLNERRSANIAKRAVDLHEIIMQAALNLLTALISGGGLLWAVGATRAGTLSIGGVVIFIASMAGVQSSVASLAKQISLSHHSLLMFSHYAAVTDAAPDLPVSAVPHPLKPMQHGIELRDVWFRYSDDHPWVLRGVNLCIPHGMTVALVGLNGAGKSTLVKLLCRFYDPTKGVILWDGVDIRTVEAIKLRKRLGVVFQDFMHYDITAAENIALGDLAMLNDRQKIENAARHAGIHDPIARLPQGYETLLTRTFFSETEKEDQESGVILSGGQWQRLALARVFLRSQCDFMILDEPSAGLDAEAEHEISESLRKLRQSRTSLLVSHKLSAVRNADLIVVLGEGRITECGDHATLIAGNSGYARLFKLQASGYQSDEE